MAREISDTDRQQLGALFWLITTFKDAEVVARLTANKELYEHLFNVDITAETTSNCRCHRVYERDMIHRGVSTLKWMVRLILRGKCQHITQTENDAEPVYMSIRLVHQAVYVRKSETTCFFLNLSEEVVNSKTMWLGQTPLTIAVQYELPKIADKLVAFGADVNVFLPNGNTPLIESVVRKNRRIFELLVSQPLCDLDVLSCGVKFRTALDRASQLESLEMVDRLLEAEADPTKSKRALADAASFGDEEMVRILIDTGADVDGDETYFTPIICAAGGGHYDICRMLLEAGADPSNRNREESTALQGAAKRGYDQVVQLLVDSDVDLEATESWGSTALQEAAWGGHIDCLDILGLAGADPNIGNDFNTTPLWGAVYGGHVDVVLRLVINNVELEVPSIGNGCLQYGVPGFPVFTEPHTPLYVAVVMNRPRVVEILLEGGYDIWSEEWLVERLSSRENFLVHGKNRKRLVRRLTELCGNPPSLQHACKISLRRTYGPSISTVFEQISVPSLITDYVLLTEIDEVQSAKVD